MEASEATNSPGADKFSKEDYDDDMLKLRYDRYLVKIGQRQKLVREEHMRLCKALNSNQFCR